MKNKNTIAKTLLCSVISIQMLLASQSIAQAETSKDKGSDNHSRLLQPTTSTIRSTNKVSKDTNTNSIVTSSKEDFYGSVLYIGDSDFLSNIKSVKVDNIDYTQGSKNTDTLAEASYYIDSEKSTLTLTNLKRDSNVEITSNNGKVTFEAQSTDFNGKSFIKDGTLKYELLKNTNSPQSKDEKILKVSDKVTKAPESNDQSVPHLQFFISNDDCYFTVNNDNVSDKIKNLKIGEKLLKLVNSKTEINNEGSYATSGNKVYISSLRNGQRISFSYEGKTYTFEYSVYENDLNLIKTEEDEKNESDVNTDDQKDESSIDNEKNDNSDNSKEDPNDDMRPDQEENEEDSEEDAPEDNAKEEEDKSEEESVDPKDPSEDDKEETEEDESETEEAESDDDEENEEDADDDETEDDSAKEEDSEESKEDKEETKEDKEGSKEQSDAPIDNEDSGESKKDESEDKKSQEKDSQKEIEKTQRKEKNKNLYNKLKSALERYKKAIASLKKYRDIYMKKANYRKEHVEKIDAVLTRADGLIERGEKLLIKLENQSK